MDLSTLPLMPSMDLPPPVEVPVPTAQRPSFDTSSNWQPEEQAVAGCTCQSYQELRERDRTASSMRQQYGSATPPTSRFVTASIAAQYDGDIYASVADAFSGAVTGRISASQPTMANIPRAAPPDPPTNRIRGRYDFSGTGSAASGLQDQVRWREPGTLQVWDSPVGGNYQWTYIEELADGTLVDRIGRRWRPTEV